MVKMQRRRTFSVVAFFATPFELYETQPIPTLTTKPVGPVRLFLTYSGLVPVVPVAPISLSVFRCISPFHLNTLPQCPKHRKNRAKIPVRCHVTPDLRPSHGETPSQVLYLVRWALPDAREHGGASPSPMDAAPGIKPGCAGSEPATCSLRHTATNWLSRVDSNHYLRP